MSQTRTQNASGRLCRNMFDTYRIFNICTLESLSLNSSQYLNLIQYRKNCSTITIIPSQNKALHYTNLVFAPNNVQSLVKRFVITISSHHGMYVNFDRSGLRLILAAINLIGTQFNWIIMQNMYPLYNANRTYQLVNLVERRFDLSNSGFRLALCVTIAPYERGRNIYADADVYVCKCERMG